MPLYIDFPKAKLRAHLTCTATGEGTPTGGRALGCHTGWIHTVRAIVAQDTGPAAVQAAFLAGDYDLEKVKKDVFSWVAENKGNSSIIILTDNINRGTQGIAQHSFPYVPGLTTHSFVEYLVKNKVGIVTGSPITASPVHNSGLGNHSIVQAWFWTPPRWMHATMRGTSFVSNEEGLPTDTDWYAEKVTHFPGKTPRWIRENVLKSSAFFNKAIPA